MKYKGYTARIKFDGRDNILVGRVLGVRAIIGFHGETVEMLRHDFESAIDFMLEDCAICGVSPQKPASGKLLHAPPQTGWIKGVIPCATIST